MTAQVKTRAQVDGLRSDLNALSRRVDILSDDMRQRFRVVTERLTAVEKKLAA
jgi:hypothetical protein